MVFHEQFLTRIESLKKQHLKRELQLERRGAVSFIHNDYLGLSTHESILEAGKRALSAMPAGARGSRLLGGNSPFFEAVEEEIAAFFDAPAALLFSTGYMANLALVRTVGELSEIYFSDEKNHASLIDAIALTRKPKRIVAHGGWSWVADENIPEKACLVAETLFSMDGDFLDFESIRKILARSDAFLILDEAHAAGVFPESGKGFSSLISRDWERMAMTVTFGKAFGVAGAAILCSKILKELLIATARSFIYTTAPAPVVAAMVQESLQVVQKEGGWRREELWDRAKAVRQVLKEALVEHCNSANMRFFSPIIPIILPGEVRALRFCENMRELDVELRAIRYPTVRRGEERIRISLNLGASREETEKMASEVLKQWTEFS
jgi:8-amino-7-oxononanoate synthase